MGELKNRMDTNQTEWAISFKELEYQQPVLVTSGVFKTTPAVLYFSIKYSFAVEFHSHLLLTHVN